MREKILDTVIKLIEKIGYKIPISEKTNFSEIGMNSLAYIKFIVAVENEFKVHFDASIVKKGLLSFRTIGTLIDYLEAVIS